MPDYTAWINFLLVALVISLVVFPVYYILWYGARLATALTIRSLILVVAFFTGAFLFYIALTLQSELLLYVVGGAAILVPLFFLVRLIALQPKSDTIILDLDDTDDAH